MTAAPTKRPTRKLAVKENDPTDVKKRIYDASIELFGRKGYEGVSIREICRAANTTAPMVYYYFGNKRDLYQAILDEASRARRVEMEKALKAGGDPISRLRNFLGAWVGVEQPPELQEMRLFFLREFFGMGSDTYKKSVEAHDRFLRRSLRTILEDGVAAGVFRPLHAEMSVIAIIGIITAFQRRIALEAPLSMVDGIEEVMSSFVMGIVPRDAVSTPAAS